MLGSLFGKTLYDRRWFTISWSIGLFTLGFIMVAFYPALAGDEGLDKIFSSMPQSVQAALGDAASLGSVEGYMASQVFDLRIPLLTIIMAIALYYGISHKEEKEGTLQFLTTLPLSREQIVLQKYVASLVIVLITFIAVIVGIAVGLMVINESIDINKLAAMTVNALFLTILAGTLIFTLSIGFGLGSAALATISALLFALYLLFVFSLSIEWLEPFRYLSPFYYNNPREVVSDGLNIFKTSVLALGSIVLYFIALNRFQKRDLN